MKKRRFALALSSITATAWLAAAASAQCRQWAEGFAVPGVDGEITRQVVWDEGSGPALYVAGLFRVAGTVAANGIARWDGSSWSSLGEAFTEGANQVRVYDMLPFDDGTGPALYAIGAFDQLEGVPGYHNVARWDGGTWSQVGGGLVSSNVGYRLAVYDDGSGPALFAAGIPGGLGQSCVWRWDGASWTALPDLTGSASGLGVFDAGQGPELYVSGNFDAHPNVPHDGLVRWNGATYAQVGNPVPGVRTEMLVWDDGSGPALFSIRWGAVDKWDGSAWTSNYGGYPGFLGMQAIQVWDDGTGAKLHVAGNNQDLVLGIAVLSGGSWVQLGGGIGTSDTAWDLTVFDDGGGPALYVGGRLSEAGGVYPENLVRWDGSVYSTIGSGPHAVSSIGASVEYDDGSGPALYAGFDLGDGHAVMRWDGSAWTQLGGTFDDRIHELHVHAAGAGPELYVGGRFDTVDGTPVGKLAHWDGAAWTDVGGGLAGAALARVEALASFDFGAGSELVVAGKFGTAGGNPAVDNVARWNGSTWSAFSGGSINGPVLALAAYDRGFGPELFIAGDFDQIAGTSFGHLARWNGSGWGNVGGTNASVRALQVWDDGTGSGLYLGGDFFVAAGLSSKFVARWDGAWSAVGAPGGGLDESVFALAVYEDEEGEHLYAGSSTFVGTVTGGLHRWDGASWTPAPGGEVNGLVESLAVHDDGSGAGPSLFACGDFTAAGSTGSYRVARSSRACPCPPDTYCTSKTNSQGCTPTIGWSGSSPSVSQASGFFVTTSNSLSNKSGLFFYGHAPKASPYQGGWLCVQAPAKRTALQNSGGTTPCGGAFSFDFNAHMASGQDPSLVPGVDVYGQYWSRDPGSTFNTIRTDAIHFLVCP